MILEFLLFIAALCAWVMLYFKWKFGYWERKGVPYIQPRFPFGNSQNRFKMKIPAYELVKSQHYHFKSQGHKHGGIYFTSSPVYLPIDLELIKKIITKDFSHFTDHGVYYDEKHDPINGHLFNLDGQKWKAMRAKVSPTFTSGKMKRMFETLLACGEQLREHIDSLCTANEPIDVKDVFAAFTTDVIGSCAFGIECNSFKEPHSEFRENSRLLFHTDLYKILRLTFIGFFPSITKMIGVPVFDPKIMDFYLNVIRKMIDYRQQNNIKRDDYLDILLELKNNPDGGGLTFEETAGQIYGFILAGFETTSTTMTFCLFELARNLDVQEKLRQEIYEMYEATGGKLTYDAVMHLKYMGQVIDETLRMYPPLPGILRKCVQDYKIPDTDIVLDKGKRVIICNLAIHYDPEYYPNPERFDPDRFTEENKAKRHPYTFLPFGEGPRMCLGMRFGIMEIRIGLALILKDYRLKVSSATQLPLKMDVHNFLVKPKETIWLDAEKI